MAVTGVLKTVEWYGRRFGVPDAMIFTELGVGMVEGIQLKEGLFTATICHTFLYEHIRDLRWEEDEIPFQTVNGLRFTFLPTRKIALTVPDTKWFKKDVFAGAQVVAQIKDRRN